MQPYKVGIIGGGPGGLMTAFLLNKRTPIPCDITLFEASDRLGGKIVTQQFSKAPVSYEAGAAELYDYSQLGPDPLREMIAEFGLATHSMSGPAVIMNGRVFRDAADLAEVFGPEAWQAYRQFTRRVRNHISPAEYYESDWREDNLDPMARRSFSALLDKIPHEAVRRYIQIATHSDLATEAHQTNAVYGMQNFLMNEPDYMQLYTIDGGIERLPRELARRIKANVRLNHAVTRVERVRPEVYSITSRHQGEVCSEEFDYVVVALAERLDPVHRMGRRHAGQGDAAASRLLRLPGPLSSC